MEQVTKLTEQEISQLQTLQQEQDQLITNFGQLEYQVQLLEIQKEKLIEQLENSKVKENEVANKLNEKYGDGVINIKEGTFSKQ